MKKIIFISGCASGLGYSIAEALEASGCRVYAGMRAKHVKRLDLIWRKQQRDIHPVRLDINNESECINTIKSIIEREQYIDVLINNAGYTQVGPADKYTSQQFLDILNTNTVGAFRLIKLILPTMIKRKQGKIINITSLNGLLALPNFSIYCASKFALEAFGLSLRYEVASKNIWVTNLAPGAIKNPDKDINKNMPHKPAREKFLILKLLMPLLEYKIIINKIRWIIDAPKPPAEVILGADAHITLFLQRFLPKQMWDKLLLYVWNR